MTLEVRVHEDLCMGIQACVEQNRDVFIPDEDGVAVATNYETADVDQMVQIAEQCPARAITVLDDNVVLVAAVPN